MLDFFDEKFFVSHTDFQNFEIFLGNFGFSEIEKISRRRFENLNGKIVIKLEGKNKYKLFLPDNLKNGDLIFIIERVRKEFSLMNSSSYDDIFTQVKVMSGIILRDMGSEDSGDLLLGNSLKYNVPLDFLGEIKTKKTDYSVTRDMISKIKSQNGNQRLGKQNSDDFDNGLKILYESIRREFYLIFFRAGIIDDKIKEDAKILREFTSIDDLKPELNRIRGQGKKEEIIKFEIEACNHILGFFYRYFETNRYRLENVLLAFTHIAYYFLNELGIKTFGVPSEKENFIGVIIGNKKYIFEINSKSSLREIPYIADTNNTIESISVGQTFKELGDNFFKEGKTKEALGMYEKALYFDNNNCSIYNVIGVILHSMKMYGEAIISYKKAIAINPLYINAYENMINSLDKLGFYKEIIPICDKALLIIQDNFSLYYKKGYALYELKKYKEALEMYEIVNGLNPGFFDNFDELKKALKSLIKK